MGTHLEIDHLRMNRRLGTRSEIQIAILACVPSDFVILMPASLALSILTVLFKSPFGFN